jgi:hypothetical protein
VLKRGISCKGRNTDWRWDFRFSRRRVGLWSLFTVFWDVVPCSQIDVERRFRGAYCLHHHGYGSSPWWWTQYTPLKRRSTSIRLHGSSLHHTRLNVTDWEQSMLARIFEPNSDKVKGDWRKLHNYNVKQSVQLENLNVDVRTIISARDDLQCRVPHLGDWFHPRRGIYRQHNLQSTAKSFAWLKFHLFLSLYEFHWNCVPYAYVQQTHVSVHAIWTTCRRNTNW